MATTTTFGSKNQVNLWRRIYLTFRGVKSTSKEEGKISLDVRDTTENKKRQKVTLRPGVTTEIDKNLIFFKFIFYHSAPNNNNNNK